MQLWQALFLAVLQGVSELFPVSSLGQTILIPGMLHWKMNLQQDTFLPFIVALHLATAIALMIYFWKDWRVVIAGFVRSLTRGNVANDDASKFAWLLVVGSVLVGALGLAFEHKLRTLFENPSRAWIVAAILVVNGFVMLYGDWLKRRLVTQTEGLGAQPHDPRPEPLAATEAGTTSVAEATVLAPATTRQRKRAEQLSFLEAFWVGGTQAFALLPGISRSGVNIVAGLFAGLTYEQASRFSFMLATPVIGLAAILKVPRLFKPEAHDMLRMAIPAFFVAGLTAYLSVRFLMRYFKHHDLRVFAYYCIIMGLVAFFMLRHVQA